MTSASKHILEVRDLRTYFKLTEGTLKAVDGVDFAIAPRQTVGIIGESGSGKSVTAQSILQIVPTPGYIQSGHILLSHQTAAQPTCASWVRAAARYARYAAQKSPWYSRSR